MNYFRSTVRSIERLLVILLSILTTQNVYCESNEWILLGPGDADQITSLTILENNDVIAGLDIGGLYISKDTGNSWSPINEGLNNLDITTKVIQDKNNPSILFTGTRGGLYKSNDYGKSWNRISNGLPNAERHTLSGSIGSVLIDPFDNKIIYTAMGYRPSSDGTTTVKKMKWQDSIYKSVDGGESWRKIPSFSIPAKVTQIYASPTTKNIIYAATSSGLYKSIDAGLNWNRLFDKNTLNIAIDPESEETIYAACNEDGVYKTTDGGRHWKAINDGLSFFDYANKFSNRYSVLEINPKNSKQLYVINSTWGRAGGLYRSDDAGDNWKLISDDMPESWLKTSRRMNDIAISENTADLIYLGSSRYIYSSKDNGKTWQQNISKILDNGWTHTGINVFGQTRDVLVDINNEKNIYIATADHKMLKSNNSGKSWELMFTDDDNTSNIWDMEMCAIQPYTLALITSGVDQELCFYKKSANEDWYKNCGEFGNSKRYEKIAISPANCNLIFLTTDDKLYLSHDSGLTWHKKKIGSENIKLHTVVFDTHDYDVVYLGTNEGVLKSTDSGSSWSLIESTKHLDVTSIYSDISKKRFLIGTQQTKKQFGAIYSSPDMGITLNSSLKNIVKYVTAIVPHPGSEKIIYASTMDHNSHDISKGSGVYQSNDAGKNWTNISNNLPVYRGYNLTINHSPPYELYFSSAGSGVYRLKIDNKFNYSDN